MAAGHVAASNALLSTLFERGGDLSSCSIILRSFEFPWALTDTRPQHAPGCDLATDEIAADVWRYMFSRGSYAAAYTVPLLMRRMEDLSGLDLVNRAIFLAYDCAAPRKVAPRETLSKAAAILDRFTRPETSGLAGYDLFRVLTCRTLLALRLGDHAGARRALMRWGEGYLDNRGSWNVGYVLMDGDAAELALSGVLASVWDLTHEHVEEDMAAIQTALNDRLSTGPSLAYGNLHWRTLLERLSRAADDAGEWYVNAPARPHWLHRSPASTSAIKATETRLGLSLPASYREFLETSNGYPPYSDFTGVGLLPVEEVGWLRDLDPLLIETYLSTDFGDVPLKLPKSLLIGRLDGDSCRLLLVPADRAAEWECWFVAHWVPGERRHRTFRYFIEDALQRFDQT